MFKAWPAGTHWYHSHVGYQRDKGLFGAFIVKPTIQDYKHIIDEPYKNVIAIREHVSSNASGSEGVRNICQPDNSLFYMDNGEIKFIRINEQNLDSILNFNETKFTPVFNVTTNKRYRFRVIGAMFLHAFRLSIDGHKLNILATDGYS